MEHLSPLQCMSQYIVLGNEIRVVNERINTHREICYRFLETILEEQISVSGAKAANLISGNNLHLAIQRFQQANQEHQESLERLGTVNGGISFFETALDKLKLLMNSQKMLVDDLINQRRQLADRIRFVDVEIQSVEDVELVRSLRKEIDWSGSMRLAPGLESDEKDALTLYISSTELEGVFVR